VARVQLNDLIVNTASGDPLTPTEGASVLVRRRGTTTAVTLYQASTGVSTWSQPIRTLAGNLQPAGTTGDIWVDEQQLDLAITPAGGGSLTKRVEAATGAPAVESVLAWELISASVQAAIENAIVAVTGKPRAVVDFGGKTYVPLAAVNVATAGVTLQNGGIIPTANIVALNIQAADVTARNMVFGRGTGALTNDGLMARSTITVQAARYTQTNCDVTGSNHACVYLANGAANGSRIEGGTFTNSSSRQNSCFVYAANGALTNDDLIVDRITGTGACSEGVLIFNANRCRITRNKLSGMTRPAVITWSTGWTNLSGNVWGHAERTDGNTRVVKDASTYLTETAVAPASLTANQWITSSGTVYVNVGGDPSTGHTITSAITGGIPIVIYSGTGVDDNPGTADMHDNWIADNHIADADGPGIYLQMTATSKNNRTRGNTIRDVCQVGQQHLSLPYAGLSISRGIDTVCTADTIETCGQHCVWVANDATGKCVGVIGKDSTGDGAFIQKTPGFTLEACTFSGNDGAGVNAKCSSSTALVLNVDVIGCVLETNALSGIVFDNLTDATNGRVTGKITDCTIRNNTQRGIQLASCFDTVCTGNKVDNNGTTSFQQIYVRGTATRCVVSDNVLTHTSGSALGLVTDNGIVNCVIGPNTIQWTSGTPTSFGTAAFRTGHTHWSCSGTPESQITAPIGSTATRRDGGTTTTFYVKESGTGNTGWIAK
jgi:hypothetical protein